MIGPAMQILDLDTLGYRECWQRQEQAHAEVAAGGPERVLVVEHPPVITLGRRADDARSHLLADDKTLRRLGVDVVESDRGGDITFHGPGQIVVYPIVRLADHGLSVGAYVRRLEQAMIDCLAVFRVQAHRENGAVGTWVEQHGKAAKVGAIGVRIRRGVTLHGLALNIDTDLNYFNLIVPCGLSGRDVTTLRRILRDACPSFLAVKTVLTRCVVEALHRPPDQPSPPAAGTAPPLGGVDPVPEAWLAE
jgi:lipoate-protein ligase B